MKRVEARRRRETSSLRRLLAGTAALLQFAAVTAVVQRSSRAAAAPVVIDFEDAAAGTRVTDTYATRGVMFNGPHVLTFGSGFAHSGSKAVEHDETCPGSEVPSPCGPPVSMSFPTGGQLRVRVWVGFSSAGGRDTIVLVALNAAGAEIGRDSVDIGPSRVPIPIRNALEVTSAAGAIRAAEVHWADGKQPTNGLAVDDVEFEPAEAALTITPNPVDFGSATVGGAPVRRTATVRSTGNLSVGIRSVRVTGGDAADFAPVNDGCTSRTLAPNASCTVDVDFSPGSTGARASTLVVSDSTPAAQHSTRLVGTGVRTTTTRPTPSTTNVVVTVPPTAPPPTAPPPPPTTGPSLILDPPIGPPGFVTFAVGTNFAPNADVPLAWAPGIGGFSAHSDGSGGFRMPVLVFHRDQLGPRQLSAADPRGAVVTAPFLVVPGRLEVPDFRFRR